MYTKHTFSNLKCSHTNAMLPRETKWQCLESLSRIRQWNRKQNTHASTQKVLLGAKSVSAGEILHRQIIYKGIGMAYDTCVHLIQCQKKNRSPFYGINDSLLKMYNLNGITLCVCALILFIRSNITLRFTRVYSFIWWSTQHKFYYLFFLSILDKQERLQSKRFTKTATNSLHWCAKLQLLMYVEHIYFSNKLLCDFYYYSIFDCVYN